MGTYQLNYSPEIFEAMESYDTQETQFYQSLARQHAGKILELGCGTGVHVLRLAELGHDAWGLDVVPQFVNYAQEVARSKPDMKGKATFVQGDMVDFHLSELFSVIFVTCGSLSSIVEAEDRLNLTRCAVSHLTPQGILVLASEFFAIKAGRWPMHSDGFRRAQQVEYRFQACGYQYEVKGTRVYNPISQMIEGEEQILNRTDPSIKHPPRMVRARLSTPHELELLLLSAGLTVVGRYGDSDGRPLDTGKVDRGWAIIVGQLCEGQNCRKS